jgi:hypothetical protein
MTNLRVASTIVAIIVAMISPILIPFAIGEYNTYISPGTKQTVFQSNLTNLHTMTAHDEADYSNKTTELHSNSNCHPSGLIESRAWNGSILMSYWGHARIWEQYPCGHVVTNYYTYATVQQSGTTYEDGGICAYFNYFENKQNNNIPTYPRYAPAMTPGSYISLPREFKWANSEVYFGFNISKTTIAGYNMPTATLNVSIISDTTGPLGITSNMESLSMGFTPSTHNKPDYPQETSTTEAMKYTNTNNAQSISWEINLAELARLSTTTDNFLSTHINLEPMAINLDLNNTDYNPAPFTLKFNLTIKTVTGAMTVNYITFTTGGLGLTGGVLALCSYIVAANVPTVRTWVEGRKAFKMVGTETDINELAKTMTMNNRRRI